MNRAVVIRAALHLSTGCSTNPDRSSTANQARTVAPASPEQAAMLEKMKALAGTWEMTNEKGQKAPIIFAVTSMR